MNFHFFIDFLMYYKENIRLRLLDNEVGKGLPRGFNKNNYLNLFDIMLNTR